jgi:hypothetical protein
MWACLTDVANQVDWFMDGKLQKLSPDDWKEIFTASLKKHQRIAAGIDGGFVVMGARTSRMKVSEMMELIEVIQAFGSEHDVQWGDVEKAA